MTDALAAITLWHCGTCGSTFRHNIGAGHLPQAGRGRCEDAPRPVDYVKVEAPDAAVD